MSRGTGGCWSSEVDGRAPWGSRVVIFQLVRPEPTKKRKRYERVRIIEYPHFRGSGIFKEIRLGEFTAEEDDLQNVKPYSVSNCMET